MGSLNALIVQSGGPAAVAENILLDLISSVEQAGIANVYGAVNGIEGIINGKLIKMTAENINRLIIPDCQQGLSAKIIVLHEQIKKIFTIFEEYDIRYLFYTGDLDSMETASQLKQLVDRFKVPIQVVGIPVTEWNNREMTPDREEVFEIDRLVTGVILNDNSG